MEIYYHGASALFDEFDMFLRVMVDPNIMGRLLVKLRDACKLEYKLPINAFDFIKTLKTDTILTKTAKNVGD